MLYTIFLTLLPNNKGHFQDSNRGEISDTKYITKHNSKRSKLTTSTQHQDQDIDAKSQHQSQTSIKTTKRSTGSKTTTDFNFGDKFELDEIKMQEPTELPDDVAKARTSQSQVSGYEVTLTKDIEAFGRGIKGFQPRQQKAISLPDQQSNPNVTTEDVSTLESVITPGQIVISQSVSVPAESIVPKKPQNVVNQMALSQRVSVLSSASSTQIQESVEHISNLPGAAIEVMAEAKTKSAGLTAGTSIEQGHHDTISKLESMEYVLKPDARAISFQQQQQVNPSATWEDTSTVESLTKRSMLPDRSTKASFEIDPIATRFVLDEATHSEQLGKLDIKEGRSTRAMPELVSKTTISVTKAPVPLEAKTLMEVQQAEEHADPLTGFTDNSRLYDQVETQTPLESVTSKQLEEISRQAAPSQKVTFLKSATTAQTQESLDSIGGLPKAPAEQTTLTVQFSEVDKTSGTSLEQGHGEALTVLSALSESKQKNPKQVDKTIPQLFEDHEATEIVPVQSLVSLETRRSEDFFAQKALSTDTYTSVAIQQSSSATEATGSVEAKKKKASKFLMSRLPKNPLKAASEKINQKWFSPGAQTSSEPEMTKAIRIHETLSGKKILINQEQTSELQISNDQTPLKLETQQASQESVGTSLTAPISSHFLKGESAEEIGQGSESKETIQKDTILIPMLVASRSSQQGMESYEEVASDDIQAKQQIASKAEMKAVKEILHLKEEILPEKPEMIVGQDLNSERARKQGKLQGKLSTIHHLVQGVEKTAEFQQTPCRTETGSLAEQIGQEYVTAFSHTKIETPEAQAAEDLEHHLESAEIAVASNQIAQIKSDTLPMDASQTWTEKDDRTTLIVKPEMLTTCLSVASKFEIQKEDSFQQITHPQTGKVNVSSSLTQTQLQAAEKEPQTSLELADSVRDIPPKLIKPKTTFDGQLVSCEVHEVDQGETEGPSNVASSYGQALLKQSSPTLLAPKEEIAQTHDSQKSLGKEAHGQEIAQSIFVSKQTNIASGQEEADGFLTSNLEEQLQAVKSFGIDSEMTGLTLGFPNVKDSAMSLKHHKPELQSGSIGHKSDGQEVSAQEVQMAHEGVTRISRGLVSTFATTSNVSGSRSQATMQEASSFFQEPGQMRTVSYSTTLAQNEKHQRLAGTRTLPDTASDDIVILEPEDGTDKVLPQVRSPETSHHQHVTITELEEEPGLYRSEDHDKMSGKREIHIVAGDVPDTTSVTVTDIDDSPRPLIVESIRKGNTAIKQRINRIGAAASKEVTDEREALAPFIALEETPTRPKIGIPDLPEQPNVITEEISMDKVSAIIASEETKDIAEAVKETCARNVIGESNVTIQRALETRDKKSERMENAQTPLPEGRVAHADCKAPVLVAEQRLCTDSVAVTEATLKKEETSLVHATGEEVISSRRCQTKEEEDNSRMTVRIKKRVHSTDSTTQKEQQTTVEASPGRLSTTRQAKIAVKPVTEQRRPRAVAMQKESTRMESPSRHSSRSQPPTEVANHGIEAVYAKQASENVHVMLDTAETNSSDKPPSAQAKRDLQATNVTVPLREMSVPLEAADDKDNQVSETIAAEMTVSSGLALPTSQILDAENMSEQTEQIEVFTADKEKSLVLSTSKSLFHSTSQEVGGLFCNPEVKQDTVIVSEEKRKLDNFDGSVTVPSERTHSLDEHVVTEQSTGFQFDVQESQVSMHHSCNEESIKELKAKTKEEAETAAVKKEPIASLEIVKPTPEGKMTRLDDDSLATKTADVKPELAEHMTFLTEEHVAHTPSNLPNAGAPTQKQPQVKVHPLEASGQSDAICVISTDKLVQKKPDNITTSFTTEGQETSLTIPTEHTPSFSSRVESSSHEQATCHTQSQTALPTNLKQEVRL